MTLAGSGTAHGFGMWNPCGAGLADGLKAPLLLP
jgi:hypothetical protein